MLEGAGQAFSILFTWQGTLLIVIGALIGLVAAILPGISPLTMMALLLVLVAGMEKYDAFTLLVSIMAAGGFAGSMTSILLNVPGDGVNAATCLDGFPLARQGRAGIAIAASATASGLGALIGLAFLVVTIPIQRTLVLAFGPAEIFALAILGVTLIGVVAAESPLKGIVSALAGMLIGLIGVNFVVGGSRYTFGVLELFDGVPLVPALIGLFAIPELIELLRRNQSVSREGALVSGGVGKGILEVLRRPGLLLRSASIGTFVGMVPGVGGTVASWMSYIVAARTSRSTPRFGKGNVEGVIAPEAALDAKEGSSLIPVFVLGIPGSVSTAILIAAFQFHGVFPGRVLFRDELPLIWVMILAMVSTNVLTSVLGLAFANQMVKLTLVPVVLLAPVVLVLGLVGALADSLAMFGVLVAVIAGLVGLVMEKTGYPRAPLLLGMIMLPLAEQNFHSALQINRGSISFLTRPLTLAILIFVVVAIAAPLVVNWFRRRRRNRTSAPDVVVPEARDIASAGPGSRWLEAVFLMLLLIGAGVFALDTTSFQPRAQWFPIALLVPFVGLVAMRLIKLFRELRSEPRVDTTEEREPIRPYWYVVGWILLLPILMWLVGAIPAIGVYIAVFLVAFVRVRPSAMRIAAAAVTSLVVVAGIHYVFVEFLKVQFPPGVLFL